MRDMTEMKRGKEGRKRVGIRELQELWKWKFWRESWSHPHCTQSWAGTVAGLFT